MVKPCFLWAQVLESADQLRIKNWPSHDGPFGDSRAGMENENNNDDSITLTTEHASQKIMDSETPEARSRLNEMRRMRDGNL